jgi:hypothetical protein
MSGESDMFARAVVIKVQPGCKKVAPARAATGRGFPLIWGFINSFHLQVRPKNEGQNRTPQESNEVTPMKKMNRFRVLPMIFCLSLMALAFLPSAKADEWNHKTIMTFDEPFEVPGVGAQILPAGTYVFKLLDDAADRHIVQIFNQAEDHVYTTILAIPNYRLRTTGKTVLTFRERGEGQPEAIHAWFYPGHQWGEEFVYPKSRALELAKIVNEPVLATPIELPAPVEALKTAPVIAVKPTGEEVAVTEVVEAPPVEVAANTAPQELPQTASPLPLVGFIGLLAFGAWFGLSALSKRIV